MKIGIELNEKFIDRIFKILNEYVGEIVDLNVLLVELLKRNVNSSDYLFLILSKLERENLIEGKKGKVKVIKHIDKETEIKIKKELFDEIENYRKIFVTPLEVGKFYQCPRRLYLEKVILARQFKKEKGKVWDGEVIHLAVNLFIDNLMKMPVGQLVSEIPKIALNKYSRKVNLKENSVKEFLLNLYKLIMNEKFNLLFTEKTLESFKVGLMGTPDIIARKENGEFVAIDIKLGRIDRSKGVKKEHLLQNIGEAILIEDFFRTDVRKIYLIYFQSNTVVKINLTKTLKDEFLRFKKELEFVCSKDIIPPKSKLPNAINRVCKGCHVKPSCENIELISSFRMNRRY